MYRVAITNVDFDRDYKNVLRFDTESDRNAYFGLSTLFNDKPLCNFKATSLVKTSITVNYLTDDLTKLLNSNYVIVRNEENSSQYFFYFIDRAEQLSGYNIRVDLTLDIFQTYYIPLTFTPCKIERAHLDRFGEVDTVGGVKKVKFNAKNAADNYLFNVEDIPEPPKRLVGRRKVSLTALANDVNNTYNGWLSAHIRAWVWVYVSAGENFSFGGGENPYYFGDNYDGLKIYTRHDAILPSVSPTYLDYSGGFTTPCRVLCVPICEPGYEFRVGDKSCNINSLYTFLSKASAYIYMVKLSVCPPFFPSNPQGETSGYTAVITTGNGSDIPGNVFVLNIPQGELGAEAPDVNGMQVKSWNSEGAVLNPFALPMQMYDFRCSLAGQDMTPNIFESGGDYINVSDIVGADHSPRFNPKMYSEQYSEFSLTLCDGQRGVYSRQKLNRYSSDVRGKYIESFTPDITRYFGAFVDDDEDAIYNENVMKSLYGLIGSIDLSMPYASDMLNEFLATNKNFYEQGNFNAGMDFGKGVVGSLFNMAGNIAGGAAQVLSGNMGGVGSIVSAPIQAVGDMVTAGMSYFQAVKNMEYTADNMRYAPDKLKSVGGNALYSMTIASIAIYVDWYEPLEADKVRINDVMHLYGYNVGAIGNIKDYDHGRINFNYVQAEIEEITSDTVTISQEIREAFVSAFARGVRLWNGERLGSGELAMYDFTPENYERRLLNE